MELLGSSSGAEEIRQLDKRPLIAAMSLAVQALASSVCSRLLSSNRHQGGDMLSVVKEPGRCVGSSPTPQIMVFPPELLPNTFTFKVANTFPELWKRYKAACAPRTT